MLKFTSEVPSLSLIWLLNGPGWKRCKTEKCQSINHKKGKWRSQYVRVFVVWLSVSVLLGILLLLPIMGQWQRIFTFIATIHSAKTSKTRFSNLPAARGKLKKSEKRRKCSYTMNGPLTLMSMANYNHCKVLNLQYLCF